MNDQYNGYALTGQSQVPDLKDYYALHKDHIQELQPLAVNRLLQLSMEELDGNAINYVEEGMLLAMAIAAAKEGDWEHTQILIDVYTSFAANRRLNGNYEDEYWAQDTQYICIGVYVALSTLPGAELHLPSLMQRARDLLAAAEREPLEYLRRHCQNNLAYMREVYANRSLGRGGNEAYDWAFVLSNEEETLQNVRSLYAAAIQRIDAGDLSHATFDEAVDIGWRKELWSPLAILLIDDPIGLIAFYKRHYLDDGNMLQSRYMSNYYFYMTQVAVVVQLHLNKHSVLPTDLAACIPEDLRMPEHLPEGAEALQLIQANGRWMIYGGHAPSVTMGAADRQRYLLADAENDELYLYYCVRGFERIVPESEATDE
jgi:hypothetical protein